MVTPGAQGSRPMVLSEMGTPKLMKNQKKVARVLWNDFSFRLTEQEQAYLEQAFPAASSRPGMPGRRKKKAPGFGGPALAG